MPVYQYVCQDCGEHFEKNLHFSESDHLVVCPQGHVHVRRIFSTPAILFKGSGWYVNDNRPVKANQN